jgi:hypothetical protein
MQCSNYLKQLTLAVHTHHDAHNRMPNQETDHAHQRSAVFNLYPYIEQTSKYEVYLGHFDRLIKDLTSVAEDYRFLFFADSAQTGWKVTGRAESFTGKIEALCCPSDRNAGDAESSPSTCVTFQNTATCSYAASYGDTPTVVSVFNNNYAGAALDNPFRRSPFGYRFHHTKALVYTGAPPLNDDETEDKTFGNIIDGTSNTLCFGERCVSTSASQLTTPVDGGSIRGATGTWKGTIAVSSGTGVASTAIRQNVDNILALKSLENTMGTDTAAVFSVGGQNFYPGGFLGRFAHVSAPAFSMFTAVLPPNSPNAVENGWGVRAIVYFNRAAVVSASSYHTGGANVSLADGGVHFVTEAIDCQTPGTYSLNGTEVNYYPPAQSINDYNGQSMFGVWGALGSINGSEAAAMP